MSNSYLQIDPKDNLLVALKDLKKGDSIQFKGHSFSLAENLSAKHKFVVQDLEQGDLTYLYGIPVGQCSQKIPKGSAIGTHNLTNFTKEPELNLAQGEKASWQGPGVKDFENRSFLGYHREDGQVGTRNIWLVLPLVFCENRNIEVLKEAMEDALGYAKPNPYKAMVRELIGQSMEQESIPSENLRPFQQVDGIRFITHSMGCGGTREDAQSFCALIAGYLSNPNVGGATVLSLGCQNAEISILKEKINQINPSFSKPLYIVDQQSMGSEKKFLEQAILSTWEGLKLANACQRKPAGLEHLKVGLECGGSDGFSGISANPLVGHFVDMIIQLNGSAILAEFPELCGVESELMERCETAKIADRFIQLMESYQAAAKRVGSGFDMNPSPGNIKDGLITDAMKSAGAAKKGGSSPIRGVLDYGDYMANSGLHLLCTPGNDVESTSALAGSGANLILFTTGLGTPTGNPVAPVIKISSNSALAQRMPDLIDFDAGPIIKGEESIEQLAEKLLEKVISIASGEKISRAEELGQYDFIPWKRGVSL